MDRVYRFFRSRIFLYTLIFLFCLALSCMCKSYDNDLYARLIVGENFIEKGVFNYNDFLSYTPTHPWYDHEWGSGVVFYFFLKYLGNVGLILLQAITTFFTVFFITKIQSLQKHAFPIMLLPIVGFLFLFFHQNPNIVRCHMFSFMFFSMFLYFLEKVRKSDSNLIWFVLPIVVIWNNLHGGVVSGIGIIAIYMVCAMFSSKPWVKYLYVLLGALPLLLINPYGYEYLKFLISANTMARTFIEEWQNVCMPIHIMYYAGIVIFVLFVLFLATSFFKKKSFNITKLALLVVTTYLGIIHIKLLSLTLIVAYAYYYNELMFLFRPKLLKILNKLAYVLVVLFIAYIPFTNPVEARTSITKFPVKEVEFLRINNIKGNLLSLFGYGSYITYKLYPNNLIYMDGRYEEVYNDEEFDNLLKFEQVEENWKSVLEKYPTEILMPDKKLPVYEQLLKSNAWVNIYEGPVCGVFVKKDMVKENYILPSEDIRYYKKHEFDTLGAFGRYSKGNKD